MIPREWFAEAQARIAAHTLRTPLTFDEESGLYLKWENHQVTGSFKARGALNKVLTLEEWERKAGLVAASAGNHGQGVALAGQLAGTRVEIFVPAHAVPAKVEAIRKLGGALHFVEGGYGETERAAKAYAREKTMTFVSPYNDGQIIAGQGTVALEVMQQSGELFPAAPQEIRAWIVPTGGGGLICGCAAVLHGSGTVPKMIGVQPAASAFTHSLFHRQTQDGVSDDPTLADGLSGAIDEASITIPMLRGLVDDIVTVPEEAIERAIALAWWTYHERIEGSAAVALAAVIDGAIAERPCVVILTGGNIQSETFDRILAEHPARATR